MRLVMRIHYTDGCTYGYTETKPFEHESPEHAIVDFSETAKNSDGWFEFGGIEFHSSRDEPEIYTLEQWLSKYMVKDGAGQQFIMIATTSDDWDAPDEETLPIEYQSVDKFKADFKALVDKNVKKSNRFDFCGTTFYPKDYARRNHGKLEIIYPRIMTVDEWFAKYAFNNGMSNSV